MTVHNSSSVSAPPVGASSPPGSGGAPAKGRAAFIEKLREEIAATEDKQTQSLLLHEAGVAHEAASEEPVAARDFLAAFNGDATFREPLEALIRILTRRRSFKNLGKLLEALAKASETSEDRARALWEHAVVALEFDKNKADAKAKLEEAVVDNPDDATSWLELEMIAAQEGDVAAVMRAIEARVGIVSDSTYKALLYIQLAELSAKCDQQARAYEFLDAAAALEGRARFQTRLVLERVAEGDFEQLSRALEGQAELIAEAVEDEGRGDEIGVPKFMRTREFAADAWLRSAAIRRALGDLDGASAMLSQAARMLPSSSVVARTRLAMLEAQGEVEAAAAIARGEIDKGAEGASAASLWLRVAEAAAISNDRSGALEALHKALAADPRCIPARAIELDLLSDGEDPAALASSLEAMAEAFTTDAAKSRAFVLGAYAWACLAKDAQAAKAALSQASALGLTASSAARLGRAFASFIGDKAWFEEATKRLLVAGCEADETAGLWFDLGRSRLLRGDAAGAEDAFGRLAKSTGEGAFARATWLGRALSALAVGLATPAEITADGEPPAPRMARGAAAFDDLAEAEADPELARGYRLVAALRALQTGKPEDRDQARARLEALHEAAPGDEIVAFFLAELIADAGDAEAAARVIGNAARGATDPDGAAALHTEAALRLWGAGARAAAIEEIEAATGAMPQAATALLVWARRGVDIDTIGGRRAAIDAILSSGGDVALAALERFALEVAWLASPSGDGDPAEALAALDTAEANATDDLGVAAALGRLIFAPAGVEAREPAIAATERLDGEGGDGSRIARAERLRVARDIDQDPGLALQASREWFEVEPTLPVAVEWLGSALRAKSPEAEIDARRAIADHLGPASRASMDASASLVALLEHPGVLHRLLTQEEAPARLMNIELAPPGCDPRRRASALHGLGQAIGADAELDALGLSGWSYLAAGQTEQALEVFKAVAEAREGDLAAWEGVRAAAEASGDFVQAALAAAQLGSRCKDDERGAKFWEYAGLTLLEHSDAHDDAEIALERAFERNARSDKAFDKLFRRVRERKDNDKLLDLIGRRLDVAENEAEIGKLFWERARVLQERGDSDGALAALENVTMLEPDHVGALALAGKICQQKGAFADAAPLFARLSAIADYPKQARLVSGITAVDIYENKLNEHDKALEVLVNLQKAGLTTLPVRERLARAAARTGSWSEATGMFEQLMNERTDSAGRVEAARFSMVIWRDKVSEPKRAQAAVEKLLEEVPDDPEALDLVLATSFDAAFRTRALGRGKTKLVDTLQRNPVDLERVSLLSRIAQAQQDAALRQATLGAMAALGSVSSGQKADRAILDELATLDAKLPGKPQVVLDARALAEIADPEDQGPVADLFAVIAETVTESLGPSLEALGVTKKNRVDPKGGPPLRTAVAEWMGALGFESDFELYVGGSDGSAVQGVAGEVPALVVGAEVTTPLSAATRSAIAREVFALRRGICAVRSRDDAAIASCAIAVCNAVGINVPNPGYAVFAEVSRAVQKTISRKVKKNAGDVCARFVQSGQDPKLWAVAARRSIDRMAAIAAGDVSLVLAEILRAPRSDLAPLVRESDRARSLLRFVLSPGYLELRKKLGMGVR
jgi:tetratricopeptide (TPR) repeat protein